MLIMRNSLKYISAIILGTSMISTPVFANHEPNSGYENGGYEDSTYEGDRYPEQQQRSDRRYSANKCSKSGTGMVLGAAVGGLLGRAVVGRYGSRSSGMIVGAGAGALAGRAIANSRKNCRRD